MNAPETRALPESAQSIHPILHAFHEFMMYEFPQSFGELESRTPGTRIRFNRRMHAPDVVHSLDWTDGQHMVVQAYQQDSRCFVRVHTPLIVLNENVPIHTMQPIVLDTQKRLNTWETVAFTLSYYGEFFPNAISASVSRRQRTHDFGLIVHDILSLRVHTPHLNDELDYTVQQLLPFTA